MNTQLTKIIKQLPSSPGVYIMKNAHGAVTYVGKAVNLNRRVSSYFVGAHDTKTDRLVAEISRIEHQPTDSALEALILEAQLIKKYSPKYNIIAKDDRSYLYVWISREKYPKVELVRGTDISKISESNPRLFGPYLSSQSLRAALDLIRKIVPYRSCHILPKKKCLYGFLSLCDAPCVAKIDVCEYRANTRELISFLNGNKRGVLRALNARMKVASKTREYEHAAILRDKINALNHIQDVAVLAKDDKLTMYDRIEGYDIANVSGQMATGSMVVFRYGQPEKSAYRKFRIKSVMQANDTAMLAEVLKRRLRHDEWPLPDIMLIDGGKPQVNIAIKILKEFKIAIPLVGIAKGPDRKKDEFIFAGHVGERNFQLFKQVRDEAHRFARGYYRFLHRQTVKRKK
jgi:excinuclease ABC subunit C